ncbi:TPM domain-containing protein [Caulobacter mirabilis]|uniref:Methanol dehydrogenase n=1 Tax=Caulobacter mirabilis TaxID=69666 RepID=A0A2D2AT78_9CAUL|nr:TPM domain-containing protein [Caulobacter mirabilis]ATQ41196.1 methanol dehydrogenase [Caulobacter mirabilis]
MTALFRAPPRKLLGALATICLVVAFALPAFAAPTFPKLTGRVVDDANILSPATEQALTEKLKTLEDTTGRQLVVATLPSLQGYEIEEYGYQLGREWGLGAKDRDDGALLIVAPNERKVRIEVGYGLEPVLTDALSSVIIQSAILPKFRDGDMEGGIVAGTDAILQQLSLPDDQAKAVVAKAADQGREVDGGSLAPFVVLFIVFMVIANIIGAFSRRRRRRSGLGDVLTGAVLGSLLGGGRDHDDWGGGGWGGGGWSGGGGFSGGGGSFGGGGASGGW